MNYLTPGVYVEEIPLFPPSVAAVATAIPAFIGHTAETQDADGETLVNRPIRLQSLLEYEALFGGPYVPASYTVNLNGDEEVVGTAPVDGDRYYLYDSLRMYFANGGGPCWIVSVGDYTADIIIGTATTGLLGGLAAIRMEDEPTILVAPDAVGLREGDGSIDFVQVGNFQAAVLSQCNDLQDRFGVFDLAGGTAAPNSAPSPVDEFRNNVGTEFLKYGAAYYPWLQSTIRPEVRFTQLQFFDDAAPPVAIPDATIDAIGTATQNALLASLRAGLAEEGRVFGAVTAPALTRANYNPLRDHFNSLIAAVDAETTAAPVRAAFSALMSFVRDLALAAVNLEGDPDNSAELNQALLRWRDAAPVQAQLTNLIAFEKNEGVRTSIANGRSEANVDTDYTDVNNTDYLGGAPTGGIGPSGEDYTNAGGNTIAQTAQAAANSTELNALFQAFSEQFGTLADLVIFRADQAETALFLGHPFFTNLRERIQREMSMLPPSGAVVGIYAATDRNRGVWKAPANASIRNVIAPAVKLNDAAQGSLNVHETGKSVNAIRAFSGKGTLIWGARTLAGNDNEWRYVNVRRFFNFVEESTKKASEPFVFEGNDANTWTRVRAMIENFLTLQWRQGALAGSTPNQAFFVKVGLGETMTADDILNGRMIVEIGMAAVRPAEFIILRFSHKMQES